MVAPKKTQGMCFYKTFDNVYLAFSASWGRDKDSYIYCYRIKEYYDPKEYYYPSSNEKGYLEIKIGDIIYD